MSKRFRVGGKPRLVGTYVGDKIEVTNLLTEDTLPLYSKEEDGTMSRVRLGASSVLFPISDTWVGALHLNSTNFSLINLVTKKVTLKSGNTKLLAAVGFEYSTESKLAIALHGSRGLLELEDLHTGELLASLDAPVGVQMKKEHAPHFLHHEGHLILSSGDKVRVWNVEQVLSGELKPQITNYNHDRVFADKGGYLLVGDDLTFWKFGKGKLARRLELTDFMIGELSGLPVIKKGSEFASGPSVFKGQRYSYFPDLGLVALDNKNTLRVWDLRLPLGSRGLEDLKRSPKVILEKEESGDYSFPYFHYSRVLDRLYWGVFSITHVVQVRTQEERELYLSHSCELLLQGSSEAERRVLRSVLEVELIHLPRDLITEVFNFC